MIGPLLFFRACDEQRLSVSALVVVPVDDPDPVIRVEDRPIAAVRLFERAGRRVLRYTFSLSTSAEACYWLDEERVPVHAPIAGDMRIAYVACDGQERGDAERDPQERNALWLRLAERHREFPFRLMLQGGDQLYADEVLQADSLTRAWEEGEATDCPDAEARERLRERLRDALFERYLELNGHEEHAWLMARVPSLCMWDDHDICDGWGSLLPEQLDGDIGRTVFEVAREHFLLFQMGVDEKELPSPFSDPDGETLTWAASVPGLHIVAPDLRSERRPDRVMGAAGWRAYRDAMRSAGDTPTFVLSSTPALGPRLSWIEAILHLMPRMQQYEDDLRDQWQSRWHRDEWRNFLQETVDAHERGSSVTFLSGEIHLATSGRIESEAGPAHQLVASGISHPPPPPAYARMLGLLAKLGNSPLPHHRIRLLPLPGERGVYTAQRNYLILERRADRWRAWWELEEHGATPARPLSE